MLFSVYLSLSATKTPLVVISATHPIVLSILLIIIIQSLLFWNAQVILACYHNVLQGLCFSVFPLLQFFFQDLVKQKSVSTPPRVTVTGDIFITIGRNIRCIAPTEYLSENRNNLQCTLNEKSLYSQPCTTPDIYHETEPTSNIHYGIINQ